ncbi:hypothetical protein GCM10009610_38570 [Pseudonocardia xinjiangensis]
MTARQTGGRAPRSAVRAARGRKDFALVDEDPRRWLGWTLQRERAQFEEVGPITAGSGRVLPLHGRAVDLT